MSDTRGEVLRRGDFSHKLMRLYGGINKDVAFDEVLALESHDAAQRAEIERLRETLNNLQAAEADYRHQHDCKSGEHIDTGRAWDKMRRAGDAARQALQQQAEEAGQ